MKRPICCCLCAALVAVAAYATSGETRLPVPHDSPDPLQGKYHDISPYTYCNGNPISLIDPSGEEWKKVRDKETDAVISYEWVKPADAYDKDGKLLPNLYKMAILFTANGTEGKQFDPQSSHNIGSSIAKVFTETGEIVEFDACTYPSDTGKYATLPAGDYEAQKGKHRGKYDALRISNIGTRDFSNNIVELKQQNPSKNHPTTKAKGINIHKPGRNNLTGLTSTRAPISMGCLLIDINRWSDFINLFPSKTTIAITIQR